MNATVEVMYAATGLEWNGRTGQDRTGDNQTKTQTQTINRMASTGHLPFCIL